MRWLPVLIALGGSSCLAFTDTGLYACLEGTSSTCSDSCWCQVDTNAAAADTLNAICGTSANDIWAAGVQVLHWDGSSWTPISAGLGATIDQLYCSGPGKVFLSGDNGLLGTCDPNGCSVMPGAVTSVPLYSITGFGELDLWAGGQAGALFHFSNGVWTPVLTPISSDILGLWEDPDTREVWSLDPGALRHKSNDWPAVVTGSGWQAFANATDDNAALHFWISDLDGGVTDVAGGAIVSSTSVSQSALWAVTAPSANDVYATGDDAGIYQGIGTNYSVIDPPTNVEHVSIHGAWAAGPGDVWAVGAAGTVLHFEP